MKRITFYVICSASMLLCAMSCSKMDGGGDIRADALPGVFTVADDGQGNVKRIRFSKGNLVATIDASGAPTAWKFATNQYDCLGEGGANKTIGTKAGDVDLFGWSTGATKYGISTSKDCRDYSGNFVDWGKAIGDGNTWCTLSSQEWQYLFNTNDTYGKNVRSGKYRYGVTVCGKTDCVVIAPDDWDVSLKPLQKNYDSSTWLAAEAAGLVCLPAAGLRGGSDVDYVGGSGSYWSSTANFSPYAYDVRFDSYGVTPDRYDLRDFGFSVRLITESK